MNTAARNIDTVWREWSSCDFRDPEYLDYLFELVADRSAGQTGRWIMGLAFLVWTPLVLGPIVSIVGVAAIDLGDQDVEHVVMTSALILLSVTFFASLAGAQWGGVASRRMVLDTLGTLALSLAHYGSLLLVSFRTRDDELMKALMDGMLVYFLATVLLVLGILGFLIATDFDVPREWSPYVFTTPMTLFPVLLLGFGLSDAKRRRRPPTRSLRKCCSWRRRRAYVELEQAVMALSVDRENCVFSELSDITLEPDQLTEWIKGLSASEWNRRCVSRHVCLRYGGLAVQSLQQLQGRFRGEHVMLKSLLGTICEDTTRRLRSGRFYCPSCHAKVARHEAGIWRFWGCRSCRRSHELIAYTNCVVAVLDNRLQAEHSILDGNLRMHWLNLDETCDFDEVEIVRAGDEDVERFVMSIQNEGDCYRRRLARTSTCRVSDDCQLFENSRRLLGRTFARMKVVASKISRQAGVA